jgi:hypothetical protein
MTEDELVEDVRYWKGRAEAAEAELAKAKDLIEGLLCFELHSGEKALAFLDDVKGSLNHG